jgi:alpha-L-fucosidase 2
VKEFLDMAHVTLRYISFVLFFLIFTLSGQFGNGAEIKDSANILWYEQPAQQWTEALPLGNGRLAAMVFGTGPKERVALNEESLWAGELTNPYPPNAVETWRQMQQSILADKIPAARDLGMEKLTISPTSFRSYEPLADLGIELDHPGKIENYRRELDLETGLVRVEYRSREIKWMREYFITAVDDVLAVRLRVDQPGKLHARICLTRKKDMKVTADGNDRLNMDGQIVDIEAPQARDDNAGGSGPGGAHMKFAGRLRARVQGGTVRSVAEQLVINDASEVVLLFTGATDFNHDTLNYDRSIDPGKTADAILTKAAKKSWPELLKDHLAEHRAVFNRVSINLGHSDIDKIPTDERIKAVQAGKEDPALAALYFQYGRYLLMSSSRRPGRLPANLQGIWNDRMWAPWEADYHLNINLQMNYWPADLCNLSVTIEPLTDWFERLAEKGRMSARKLYDADGWVAFHATNPFGRTTPSGSNKNSQLINGVYDPLAGAWMAMTLWRHYEFTQDREFLKQRAYPILKGASEFIFDYLVQDKDGFLVTTPSTSPENSYIHPQTGKALRLTRGSTYHNLIIRSLFEAVIQAATILERDGEFKAQLSKSLLKIPPIKIGKDGTIQEWIEDYKEQDPHHRHMSHLLGLYPFSLITPEDRELFTAARKTIERRGFGGDVGWSNAWKISLFARLLDPEEAYRYLGRLIARNTFANLMDSCFPGRIFQIDGNFGGTAGIAEMLLQSHAGQIHLLPALPKAWPTGQVRGLKARGGFIVDIEWQDSHNVKAKIKSLAGLPARIRLGEQVIELKTKPGQEYPLEYDCSPACKNHTAIKYPEFYGKEFRFQEATGLGLEENVTRRDPSDIIKVGDLYYVWYSKVDHTKLSPRNLSKKHHGYIATVWYAVSRDQGHTWVEKGRALGLGEKGQFDSFAVFTPNIVKFDGRYYLYYTAVKATDENGTYFANNSSTDFTAIGVAVADSPDGPFRRIKNNPVLVPSPVSKDKNVPSSFDSYRVDDAALLVRDYDGDGDLDIWLYYKGRNMDHGVKGAALTCMGLAIADTPESKHIRINDGKPILSSSHEVLIWPHREGVAAYASKTKTLEYAPDGIDFTSDKPAVPALPRPVAPGVFRPDLTQPIQFGKGIQWGIAMKDPAGPCPYLVRIEIDLTVE